MAKGFHPLTANQYQVVNHSSQATTQTYEPAKLINKGKSTAQVPQYDPS